MLVAKGYAQTYGIYYDDTFVHISQMMATTKTIIVVAASKCQFLNQMNFKNTPLQGELQEEMYIDKLCKQVEEGIVWTKPSPTCMTLKKIQYLIAIGFHMIEANHYFYI